MSRVKRWVAIALLPLSIVPVVVALPKVQNEYDDFARAYLDREALPAPGGVVSAREARAWRPVRVPRGRIPVLVYHGINDSGTRYAVPRERFAEQVAMLDLAGFQTVSAETYARFMRGERVKLPRRPLLLTFDDSRLDSFRGADRVLERHGFRAVMFAISGRAGEKGGAHSTWDELRAMQESGRWDVQFHAGDGHVRVRTGARGGEGAFYANRIWSDGGIEPRDQARRRILEDLVEGERAMAEEIRGYRPWLFAAPFGDFGQLQTNDPALQAFNRAWLGKRFDATFVQGRNPEFSRDRGPAEVVERYEVKWGTSTSRLYRWLSQYGPDRKERR